MNHFHHLLIGLPASGKSTFAQTLAQFLAQQNQPYIIISTDQIRSQFFGEEIVQGDWSLVETEAIGQIEKAIASGQTIIYDATNYKRAWRMNFLEKVSTVIGKPFLCSAWYLTTNVETCKQWNQNRSRHVPDIVIDKMATSLTRFPPEKAEGFVIVNQINLQQQTYNLKQLQAKITSIPRRLSASSSRTTNYELHQYSRLLDFERLMHLISLILQYPGLGNLQTTNPSLLAKLFGKTAEFDTELAEICAIMGKLRGEVYAKPEAIKSDLDWLERNGILGTTEINAEIEVELIGDAGPLHPNQHWHRYSDRQPFERLIKLIRYIVHHPFNTEITETSEEGKGKRLTQKDFLEALQVCGIIPKGVNETNNLRRDIEKVLKPYKILVDFAMKRGYFAGTGVFSKRELEKLYGLLQSQKVHLDDPVAVEMLQLFEKRIEASKLLELEQNYPVRVIGNRGIVNPKKLSSRALSNRLEQLEKAILSAELLELVRIPGTGRFPGQTEGSFTAYPLQIVFHNIAWYLGYEIKGGEKDGLLEFERLDRLSLEREQNQKRTPDLQQEALGRLTRLYKACPGIFLGKNAEDQNNYLSKKAGDRKLAETLVELWVNDTIFKCLIEGNQRFLRTQMKMSKRPNEATQEKDSIYTLPTSPDSQFPYRFQVTLPKWSVQDVDLKSWILGFGGQVKVIQPKELREKIKCEGEEISCHYQ